MIRLVLRWISERLALGPAVSFVDPLVNHGELYRADAKAEGDLVVLGGWEVAGGRAPAEARWFSLRLGRKEIPWAYTRGDPFRSIGALELLASLLCILAFRPAAGSLAGARVSFTAGTDNRANGFALDRLMSTKYPMYLVLMELAVQMESAGLLMSVAWRPRDENEEADALTNEVFTAFTPAHRVELSWSDLPLAVLPEWAGAAEALFQRTRDERRGGGSEAATPAPTGQRRKARRIPLREREPW